MLLDACFHRARCERLPFRLAGLAHVRWWHAAGRELTPAACGRRSAPAARGRNSPHGVLLRIARLGSLRGNRDDDGPRWSDGNDPAVPLILEAAAELLRPLLWQGRQRPESTLCARRRALRRFAYGGDDRRGGGWSNGHRLLARRQPRWLRRLDQHLSERPATDTGLSLHEDPFLLPGQH